MLFAFCLLFAISRSSFPVTTLPKYSHMITISNIPYLHSIIRSSFVVFVSLNVVTFLLFVFILIPSIPISCVHTFILLHFPLYLGYLAIMVISITSTYCRLSSIVVVRFPFPIAVCSALNTYFNDYILEAGLNLQSIKIISWGVLTFFTIFIATGNLISKM